MKTTQPKLFPEAHNPADDVCAALGLVQGALGDEEQRIRTEGAQAMQQGDFDTAASVIDFARRLLSFRDRVGQLEKEWASLEAVRDAASPEVQEIVSKRFFGRRGSAEITPHQAYCRPLLEVLVEMGGGGRTRDVLDRLGDKMKSTLKPKDYETHKSDTQQIRWRNAAQWARNLMVNTDGRMKKGTANGRWEISDKGRVSLRSNQSA
jgi:hypothetical protein